MARIAGFSLLFFCLLFVLKACKPERTVTKALYYGKTVVDLDQAEQAIMTQLQVKKLSVKFFDVTWDARMERPIPAAQVKFAKQSTKFLADAGIEIVPTVFIANEILDQIVPEAVPELGERIDFLLRDLLDTYRITNINEVQIDCDWTEKTRDKYFDLLRYLKTLPFYLRRELSAAIRLNQCKSQSEFGVPPVNKGQLLCYNVGNSKGGSAANPILDVEELKDYSDNLGAYPLPLDIGLPLTGGRQLFRNNNYNGLIQHLTDSLLMQRSISNIHNNEYEILVDTSLYGYELKKGDRLKSVTIETGELLKAIKLVSPQWRAPNFSIFLYQLDSVTLVKYKVEELESFYRSFQ